MHCDTFPPDLKSKQYFFQNIVYMEITWLYVIICDYLVPLLCASWFACHSFLSIAASIFFLYLACPSFTNQHLYSLTSVTELPRAFLFKSFHWHEPSSLFGRPLQVQLSAGADLALGGCLHPHHQSLVLLVIHVPSSTWPCQLFSSYPFWKFHSSTTPLAEVHFPWPVCWNHFHVVTVHS